MATKKRTICAINFGTESIFIYPIFINTIIEMVSVGIPMIRNLSAQVPKPLNRNLNLYDIGLMKESAIVPSLISSLIPCMVSFSRHINAKILVMIK